MERWNHLVYPRFDIPRFYRKHKWPIIISGAVAVIFILIGIGYGLHHLFKNGKDSICSTSKCHRQAAFLLKRMDQNVNPCDDFYKFACGGFIKFIEQENLDIEESITQMDLLKKNVLTLLDDDLKMDGHDNDDNVLKNMKIFYKDCIEEKKDTVSSVINLLKELGGWPLLEPGEWNNKSYRYEDTVGLINNAGFESFFPFELFVDKDPLNPSKMIMELMPVTYGEAWSLPKDRQNLIKQTALALGANNENIDWDITECVDFEIKLRQAMKSQEELFPWSPKQMRHSVADVIERYPNIDWIYLFDKALSSSNISVTSNDGILIPDPHWVNVASHLLKNTEGKTILNYLIWRLVENMLKIMPENLKKSGYPVNLQCVNLLTEKSAVAMNYIYLENHFDRKIKSEVEILFSDILTQSYNYLLKIGWMAKKMKNMLLKQLESLKAIIGYPHEFWNVQKIIDFHADLKLSRGSLFNNYRKILALKKYSKYFQLKKSQKEVSWISKASYITRVIAGYFTESNELALFAGVLQLPFFERDRPKYLNYGSMGSTIGHEILHAIIAVIKNGNETINDVYKIREQCVINQFNNYEVSQINRTVDGNRTLDENIADAGGFKLSYLSYHDYINQLNLKEPRLPNLMDYTPQQMFWISAASHFCSYFTDDALHSFIDGNEHSPPEARINVGFSNLPEFAKDFQCPLGSKMNPKKKCEVW